MLARLLAEPLLAGADIDGAERIDIHMQILRRKRMIREVFEEFHHIMLAAEARYLAPPAPGALRIELGAGVYPIRVSDPTVLATDIVDAPHLDRVIDAQQMAVTDGSVRTLFGQNCFHHFPDPERFFHEAMRVLQPGGGIILIEPGDSVFASVLYQHLFATEHYNKRMQGWTQPISGPMSNANQALSHIIFVRDRAYFERTFPALSIEAITPLNSYLRYLLSGGLNFRQLLPDASIPLLRGLERGLSRLPGLLPLHHLIVLKKRG